VEHWEQDYVASLLDEADIAATNGRKNLAIALLANALVVSLRAYDQSLADQAKRISLTFGAGVAA
jgi:hypothetical protein